MSLSSQTSAGGVQVQWHAHGALLRISAAGVMVNLFPALATEAAFANLWLRVHAADGVSLVPLLGPASPLRALPGSRLRRSGQVGTLEVALELRLAASQPAWFWHVLLRNAGGPAQQVDLVGVQDVGLSAAGSIRLNEHYVSHYIDLTPLQHARRGWVVAARQNLAVDGRNPWLLMGSLRRCESFATDALQLQGLGVREGAPSQGLRRGLPGQRLQHEHALIALQEAPRTLAAGDSVSLGFFSLLLPDHPAASGADDLARVAEVLALPEARATRWPAAAGRAVPRSVFADAPWLASREFDAAEFALHYPGPRRHQEFEGGRLLSFFDRSQRHVVLRAKELAVMRPHGHLLRSGRHLVPDETALTSTVWMGGVFHSMLTQGHVAINRLLSTSRGWLGPYRSTGLRAFVDSGGGWQQLGLPSSFEIEPEACRWLYRHEGGLIEVRSEALADAAGAAQAMALRLRVLEGPPVGLLLSLHIALAGDDGLEGGLPPWRREGGAVFAEVPAGSALAERFPQGGFALIPEPGTPALDVSGDEALWRDGIGRGEPWLCLRAEGVRQFGLRIEGRLLDAAPAAQQTLVAPLWHIDADGPVAQQARRLGEIVPWFVHNALVHYLSPRGLEQYSGGGWGTRDVCQGPLEMLLALDRQAPVRDLIYRVFAAQNEDGDWPQWFMFFERERNIRAGDAHGDIVFWPLLGLGRYLLASGDATLLNEALPFHGAPAPLPLWQHVERALALIETRRIAGTALAAYGHGDWNDSLQPADPALRERLCSAWTVTLHHQMLHGLARGLRTLGRDAIAARLLAQASAVAADFQRLLVPDGVVTGYAMFTGPDAAPKMLLHPRDGSTGVHYSLLAMMHAVLEGLLPPASARTHLALIEQHLSGPDGARLFDRPLPYRGGPQQIFQRAESSAFFGREIGAMYMHAHLRYAEMLAHLGEADRFWAALSRAHPVALRELVPMASLRQANCYYSSSDAAFADRWQASREYVRVAAGQVALDGGWRVYSSGPGIALALIIGGLLGLRREATTLLVDPVMPSALDGLKATLPLAGRALQLRYRLGPLGCGVTRLLLDGRELPFTRRDNPYRIGAAAVALSELADAGVELEVHTG